MPNDEFALSSETWAQVQDLMAEALERPPETRTAFLRRACGDNPGLYREVESLLVAYDEAGSFLDTFDAASATVLLTDEPVTEEPAVEAETFVGPYRILRLLGRGGMGLVYLAEDTRLKRNVALKFLPPNLTVDAEAQRQLLSEAQAAAALDHPHIGVIHEIGETDDGRPFIAMAYYEGESLQERIARGPFAVSETLRLGLQITRALQAAHQRGIIHRDIKPSNILITAPDSSSTDTGTVKLVDFGIALHRKAEAQFSKRIQGTVAYMSPEQTRGETFDTRTDIWSLGVILYEMLTGERPFRGSSDRRLIEAIRQDVPPPVSAVRNDVPDDLESLIQDCLVKDPHQRPSSMTQILARLEPLSKPARKTGIRRPVFVWTGVGLATLGLILFALFIAPAAAPTDLEPRLPTPLTSYTGYETEAAISPDGNWIAFSRSQNAETWDLYVKPLGRYDPTRLTSHPDIDSMPAWSPDGRHIAFLRYSPELESIGLYLIPAQGGDVKKLTDLRVPSPVSWSPDGGSLIFVDRDAPEAPSRVYALSLETLEREPLTDPPYEFDDLDAHLSPDGTLLAVTRDFRHTPALKQVRRIKINRHSDLYVIDLASRRSRRLTFDRSSINGLAWTPDGQELIYSSDRISGYGDLNLWRVSISGGPSHPLHTRGDFNVFPTISPDGRLAYIEGTWPPEDFWRYEISDTAGLSPSSAPLIDSSGDELSAAYSPDGSRIAFASTRSGSNEIWICNHDGSDPIRLTFMDGPRTGRPRWSPDGQWIVFDSWLENDKPGLYVVSAAGGPSRSLLSDSLLGMAPVWSPDGAWIYFNRHWDLEARTEIWKVPSEGGQALPVVTEGAWPQVSPDGQWVFYTTPHTDSTYAIWKRPVEGSTASRVIDHLQIDPRGGWRVFDEGLYFVEDNSHADPQPTEPVFTFFGFDTGETKIIDGIPDYSDYLDVSPDRKYLLVKRYELGNMDVVMLDNWR